MSSMIEDKLKSLANDENMLKALRFVIDKRIEVNKPEDYKKLSNEVLGANYRASEDAKNIIKGLFTDIMAYKEHKSKNNLTNKGR